MSEEILTVENEDRLLTVTEMAEYLSVKPGTLKDWTKRKENPCPCFRSGPRTLRFIKEDVMEWFRKRTQEWMEQVKNEDIVDANAEDDSE